MSDYLVGFGQLPTSQRLLTRRSTHITIPRRPLDDLGPMYTKPGQMIPPREEVYPLHEQNAAEQQQQPEPSEPEDKTAQYVMIAIAGLGVVALAYYYLTLKGKLK